MSGLDVKLESTRARVLGNRDRNDPPKGGCRLGFIGVVILVWQRCQGWERWWERQRKGFSYRLLHICWLPC